MINKRDEVVPTQKQEPKKRTVWVIPFSRTRLPLEPMKADAFGYDDWEIYHG